MPCHSLLRQTVSRSESWPNLKRKLLRLKSCWEKNGLLPLKTSAPGSRVLKTITRHSNNLRIQSSVLNSKIHINWQELEKAEPFPANYREMRPSSTVVEVEYWSATERRIWTWRKFRGQHPPQVSRSQLGCSLQRPTKWT